MPLFRITAALTILWLIQPEIVRAPVVGLAKAVLGSESKTKRPEEVMAELCKSHPQACASIATTVLKEGIGSATGSVKNPLAQNTSK
jgi:hypothetical protein